MKKHYSLAGKLLRVNLNTGKITFQPTLEISKKYLGGRGINWRLLYNEVKPYVKPLEPANKLFFGSGLLVGTLTPCAARFQIDSKNPITGGIGSSNSGGHFSSELKFAGYDNIIFQGRSKHPVYLWIDDDKVKIMDASRLWGSTVSQTDDLIKDELGDTNIQIAAIGQGGENLVRYACIIANRGLGVAGKCGLGAVMGSKNLKAIAIRGSGKIEIYDPEGFIETVKRIWDKISYSERANDLSTFSTLKQYLEPNWRVDTIKNFQEGYIDSKKIDKIGTNIFLKYVEKKLACFACPIHCRVFSRIKDGPYSGLVNQKLDANAITNFGATLDIDYVPAIIKAQRLCAEYGLDIDGVTTALSWAFECYQRRILERSDTDGIYLEWGNYEAVIELIEKIAFRKGFGDVLAEGVKRCSETIGRGSEKYAMHIKGMGNREYMRPLKGWALGIAVALRGGGHTTGSFIEPPYTKYEGKPELVVYTHKLKAILDSLGICNFLSDPNMLNLEDIVELISKATGLNYSKKQLLLIGERIHNIGKAFNVLHVGFSRKDDYPPKRLMEEPIKSGPFKGECLEKNKWDIMLDRYYELMGWDKKTSFQKEKTLEELNLTGIKKDLINAGRIK